MNLRSSLRSLVLIFTGAVLAWAAPAPARAAEAKLMVALLPKAKNFPAGRLGVIAIIGDNLMLGKPFIFNRGNIDGFDF